MNGWHTQVSGEAEPITGAIGVVVAQKFPDPNLIREKLEEGIARVHPDTVWVLREAEREGHAIKYAWQTFRSHGIVPILSPLVPAWKSKGVPVLGPLQEGHEKREWLHGYDLRATWRDSEMRGTLERIVVFHDKSSNVTAQWAEYRDNGMSRAKIYVVERGKTRVKRYKQGKAMS